MGSCGGVEAAEALSLLDIGGLDRAALDGALALVKRVDGWLSACKIAIAT
jgi:hypothetical protein